jgi:PAS domain S-box-containing protein
MPDNLAEIVDEEGRKTWSDLLEGFGKGIFPHSVDLPVVQDTGEKAIIALSLSLVPRQTEVILITLRNVSLERHIERRLAETKAFLEKIIAGSVDAIIAADMMGRIVLFNETASRLWGIPVEEALSGLHVTDLYPPGQAQEIMRKLRSEDFGGAGRMEPERIWLMNRSGENVPVILSAYIIYEEGREAYSIGVFSDLREKIRTEQKIAMIEEKLAASEKQVELAELAGAMAHELNQPLTSIYGSTEILVRRLQDDPRSQRYAKIIQEEASRMSNIIRKIGRVTKFETQSYVGSAKIADLGGSADDGPGRGGE